MLWNSSQYVRFWSLAKVVNSSEMKNSRKYDCPIIWAPNWRLQCWKKPYLCGISLSLSMVQYREIKNNEIQEHWLLYNYYGKPFNTNGMIGTESIARVFFAQNHTTMLQSSKQRFSSVYNTHVPHFTFRTLELYGLW